MLHWSALNGLLLLHAIARVHLIDWRGCGLHQRLGRLKVLRRMLDLRYGAGMASITHMLWVWLMMGRDVLVNRRRRFRHERAMVRRAVVVLREEASQEDGKLMKGLGVGDVDFHGEGMLRMGHGDS